MSRTPANSSRLDVHHHHGPIGHADDVPHGNGVLLWFEVDIDAVIARAQVLNARRPQARARNFRKHGPSGEYG